MDGRGSLLATPAILALQDGTTFHGTSVGAEGQTIGEVTSGTFSPTLNCPIALGYVQPDFAKVGLGLTIDVRGRGELATVVKLPFYRR